MTTTPVTCAKVAAEPGATFPAVGGRAGADLKPWYLRLKRTEGSRERLCNGPIHSPVIGLKSHSVMQFKLDSGGEMLSKEYFETARTILQAAQTMTDQHVARQLKALADDYERRAAKAAETDAAKTLARSVVRAERERMVEEE